jgi:hypothetical protein
VRTGKEDSVAKAAEISASTRRPEWVQQQTQYVCISIVIGIHSASQLEACEREEKQGTRAAVPRTRKSGMPVMRTRPVAKIASRRGQQYQKRGFVKREIGSQKDLGKTGRPLSRRKNMGRKW